MDVEIIASRTGDNHFYLLHSGSGSEGLLIDPVDAETALSRAKELGVVVTQVVNTHWHPDHTGGNAEVLAATGARLSVPHGERDLIKGTHHGLEAGDILKVSETQLEVVETPGHTVGHISLHTPGHLFCGDTVFVGGAGNCRFGGDPAILFETFRGVLGRFDDDTIFYPGHDYSVRNLEFCLHIEESNTAAAAMLTRAREQKLAGAFVQSTLGQERRASPFMRSDDHDLHEALATKHPEVWKKYAHCTSDAQRAFLAVRDLRNNW